MISRKLFADQIRANSLTSTSTSTSAVAAGTDGQKSMPVRNYQCSTPTSMVANQVQTTTTFPAPAVNRRVVQVHPMCMNSTIGDHQEILVAHQGQMSSSSSSSGQYSPPNMSHSPPMQNTDSKSSKPRPPVPKKPAKLTTMPSAPKVAQVPARPPKPFPGSNGENGNGNVDEFMTVDASDGNFLNYGQRENGSVAATMLPLAPASGINGSNGTSPYKQRKQLEDEEKCRELSNYVAQKSNDSSLKQILAPNQRSSVDYLEECFANVRLSSLFGENGGDGNSGQELVRKSSFYSTTMNGQGVPG